MQGVLYFGIIIEMQNNVVTHYKDNLYVEQT